MASDRWRSLHEPTRRPSDPNGKVKSNGINPSLFYTKRRKTEVLTASQKQLDEILHLAARNEIVQRRNDYTAIQNLRCEAYREVTRLQIFPLQDLAIQCFTEMMRDYRAHSVDGKTITCNTLNQHHEMCDQSPKENNERIKTERHWGEDLDGSKKQDKAMFLEEFSVPQPVLPELWSMEPRIFALETSLGKRKYIAGNLGRFLRHYWKETDPQFRHYYELIPEGTPCRLYFDLEFSKVHNQISPQESEVLMTEFIDELCQEFLLVHDINMSRSCVVDLEASTEAKFSRHLIVHLPNGELFADSHSAGLFVKRFVGRLVDELLTGMLEIKRPTLAKCLFVKNQSTRSAEQKSFELEKSGKTTDHDAHNQQEREDEKRLETLSCFVDLGVYTRNRLFRLMGSTKWGKCASSALRIADANTFCFPSGFSNSKFYTRGRVERNPEPNIPHDTSYYRERDHEAFCSALNWELHAHALSMTFVVPVNRGKINYPVLLEQGEGRGNLVSAKHSSSSRRDRSLLKTCKGASPIQSLDDFFLQLSRRGGIQGKIRAWSHEGSYFFYQMSENRWCEHIGRAHKSNNIIWNVDLKCKNYWQSCHDPDCRAANFHGVKTQLPEELASLIDEYLIDQELGELDEEKVISEAIFKYNCDST